MSTSLCSNDINYIFCFNVIKFSPTNVTYFKLNWGNISFSKDALSVKLPVITHYFDILVISPIPQYLRFNILRPAGQ